MEIVDRDQDQTNVSKSNIAGSRGIKTEVLFLL